MALTTEQRLAAAEDAYHKLQTGLSVREVVDQNGERVAFTPANRQALYSYIQALKAELAGGSPTVTTPRAIGFYF